MAITPEVPGTYPIAIDGRGFLVDWQAEDGGFVAQSIPLNRNQADQGARPGEQSMNIEDMWRRSVESWHHGAGQSRADRGTSDPYRFRTSLHADVFTKFKLGILNMTTQADAYAAVGPATLVVAGAKLFWQRDNALRWTSDGTTYASITGLPAAIWSAASDGQNVYTVHGTDDLFRTPASGTAGSSYVTVGSEDLQLVRFAKGRLLAFDTSGAVYNPVVAGALPTALYTHPLGASFHWTDATEGEKVIYMAGYSGTGSEAHGVVYYTTIKPDGTALDVPIQATRLPDGEQALAICGYLGLVFIGTNLGVRVCLELEGGALRLGPLIESGECKCFEPQGQQVWFGWGDDSGYLELGLGRIDLTDFEFGDGAPPYATDLTPTIAGSAMAVATFGDSRYFVTITGLQREGGGEHPVAYLSSGAFNYDLTESKAFHYLTVKGDNGAAVATVTIAATTSVPDTEGLAPVNLDLGDATFDNSAIGGAVANVFDLGGIRSESLDYTLQYAADISRVTLQARPALGARSEIINVTVLLTQRDDILGLDRPRDVRSDAQFLRDLMRAGAPIDFQDGSETYKVTLEDYQIIRERQSDIPSEGRYNGVARLRMKRFDTITAIFRSYASATVDGDNELTLPAPDGSIAGDRLFASVAWASSSVTATASAGWEELAVRDNTDMTSGIYARNDGSIEPLVLTFSGNVDAVGVVAAYTTPQTIVDYTERNEDTAIPLYDDDPTGDRMVAVFPSIQNASAMLLGTASIQDGATGFGLTAPLRARARAIMATAGPKQIAVEVGDGISVSKYMLEQDVGEFDAGAIYDVQYTLLAYTNPGEVQILVAGLVDP